MKLETLWQDFRHALRLMRLNPGFTSVALVSLALGIGANTAIFQMLDAVRLRMLPVKNPDKLVEVRIDSKSGRSGSFINPYSQLTYAQWQQLRERQQGFSQLFAWGPDEFNLASGGEVRNSDGLWVSGDVFSDLGLQPVIGRMINAADDRRGCGLPPAVISYSFWQREYGGDRAVIGRKLNLNGHPVEIVGVAPASFYGLVVGRRFDVAVPICGQAAINGTAVYGESSVLDVPYVWWLSAIGRLKPGWTMEKAVAQLNSIAPSLFHDTLPRGWAGDRARQYLDFRFKILPAGNGASSLREDYSTPLWLLLGIAGLVLLIACANLANLMLARASVREREIAVRLAVGASRARIIRQLLTESVLLAIFGSILGFGLAQWVSRSLVLLISGEQGHLFLEVKPDWSVLAFTAAVAMATCILFGLAPAFRATRVSPQAAMKTGRRGTTGNRESFGLRHGLVVSQVAMSLALLFGALLFTRTLRNLMVVDAGFQQSGILVTQLDFTQLNVPLASRAQYRRQILERIRAIPGVDAAAEVDVMPISGNGIGNDVWTNSTPQPKHNNSAFNLIGPGYFETLGTPLLAGRDFSDLDTASSTKVAIINEKFAKKLELGSNAIGKIFRREATSREPSTDFQIVGLVKDTKYFDLREDFLPIAYLPIEQNASLSPATQIVVRSSGTFADLTSAIKHSIGEISPSIDLSFRNFHSMIGDSLLQERLMAMLSSFFGLLAGILATVGLYGVISYMVIRRTNEIGIRIALGADRAEILTLILQEAGVLLAIGVAAGVVLSLIGARTAKTLLYGMKSYDPATLLGAILLLGIVSIAASALPARRAANMDPMVALREE